MLEPSQISVHDQTISDDLMNFVKELLCDGLAQNDDLQEVCNYVRREIEKQQEGEWFCGIKASNSNSQFSFNHFQDQVVGLRFIRNSAHYEVDIMQIADNCERLLFEPKCD